MVRDEWDWPDVLILHAWYWFTLGCHTKSNPHPIPSHHKTLAHPGCCIQSYPHPIQFHAALMSPSLCTKLAQPRMLHEEISLPIPSHPAPLSSQQNTCVPWDITPGIICIPSHHTTHGCLKMLHQEVTPTPSPVLNVPPEVKSPLQGYQLPGPLLSPGIPTWRQGCRLQHRWAGRAPGAGPRVPVPRESGHG